MKKILTICVLTTLNTEAMKPNLNLKYDSIYAKQTTNNQNHIQHEIYNTVGIYIPNNFKPINVNFLNPNGKLIKKNFSIKKLNIKNFIINKIIKKVNQIFTHLDIDNYVVSSLYKKIIIRTIFEKIIDKMIGEIKYGEISPTIILNIFIDDSYYTHLQKNFPNFDINAIRKEINEQRMFRKLIKQVFSLVYNEVIRTYSLGRLYAYDTP